jgi:uncharacterized protein
VGFNHETSNTSIRLLKSQVIEHYQDVALPSEYATQALDKNHTGLISIQQIAKDPFRYSAVLRFLVPSSVAHTFLRTNNTKVIANFLLNKFANNTIEAGYISIDKQLKPFLMKSYENATAFKLSKCNNLGGCPIWWRSMDTLIPTLSIIGNVSKSTGVLPSKNNLKACDSFDFVSYSF